MICIAYLQLALLREASSYFLYSNICFQILYLQTYIECFFIHSLTLTANKLMTSKPVYLCEFTNVVRCHHRHKKQQNMFYFFSFHTDSCMALISLP